MRRSLLLVAVTVGIIVAWSVGRVQGQMGAGKVVFTSAEKTDFKAGPTKGVSMSAIWRRSHGCARHVDEIRSGIRRRRAHAHERRVDRGHQRRVSI